jgi:4-amino-4-deoxy-L-arabinose transferase-like glycosyltransferase
MNQRLKSILLLNPVLPGLAALFFLELAWFALLHPLVPSTAQGFLIEFATGIAVFFCIGTASYLITRLLAQKRHIALCKILAVAVALGVGLGVYLLAYAFKSSLSDNFRYCPDLIKCLFNV